MISDLHFAINHNVGTRRCSDSPRKLERLREVIASCELRVQLGDLINGSGDTSHDTAALSLESCGAVVFCHQNFDDRPDDPHVIRNADIVRRIFAASGKVRYVFCGHYHAGGDSVIDGIRYHTLPAVCEGSSIPYCIAEINAWDDIVVTDSCIDLGS